MELQSTFSEKLNSRLVAPWAGEVTPLKTGGELSHISAVEAEKSIVKPFVEVENWLTLITYVSPVCTEKHDSFWLPVPPFAPVTPEEEL